MINIIEDYIYLSTKLFEYFQEKLNIYGTLELTIDRLNATKTKKSIKDFVPLMSC
jgi:hypothetical protein